MFGLVATSQASIYNIANYPNVQEGWTLTGTITTTDVGTTATVDSVAVTLTNGTASYLLNKFEANVTTFKIIHGTDLTIPFNGEVVISASGTSVEQVVYVYTNPSPDYHAVIEGAPLDIWYYTPQMGSSIPGDVIGLNPMIIGTLQTPEPASLTVWALLGLVGVVYLRRRRSKA